jgi:hypothetical protein
MKKLLLLLLLTFSLQAQTITQMWESSAEYKEYLAFVERGDVGAGMKIKREAINTLTEQHLSSYLNEFKPKYRKRYLEKYCEMPFVFRELAYNTHKALSPTLKNKTQKEKNKFAQMLYMTLNFTYKENGLAQKYLKKLTQKYPELKTKKIYSILDEITRKADEEAAKTPQQKQKEYEEYMAKLKRNIAKSERNIAKSERNIAKWDEIIDRMKGI